MNVLEFKGHNVPPRQAPNASVQISGLSGRQISGESANLTITGI